MIILPEDAISLTQSLLPVVALMALSAVSATDGKGESNNENRVEKWPEISTIP
jgi:hypothetical protein